MSEESLLPPFAEGSFVEHIGAHDKGLCKMLLGERVIVAGSGPLDEALVRDMLTACGLEVWPLVSPVPDVLILGQEGWDEDELVKAVLKHNGHRLRVYSHEMFLATLITGADVYKYRDLDELELFADGHPAWTTSPRTWASSGPRLMSCSPRL